MQRKSAAGPVGLGPESSAGDSRGSGQQPLRHTGRRGPDAHHGAGDVLRGARPLQRDGALVPPHPTAGAGDPHRRVGAAGGRRRRAGAVAPAPPGRARAAPPVGPHGARGAPGAVLRLLHRGPRADRRAPAGPGGRRVGAGVGPAGARARGVRGRDVGRAGDPLAPRRGRALDDQPGLLGGARVRHLLWTTAPLRAARRPARRLRRRPRRRHRGDADQVALPGDREPRAAYPAQRHRGLRGPAPRARAGRRGQRARRDHRDRRPVAPQADQRPARPLPPGVGAPGGRPGGVRGPRPARWDPHPLLRPGQRRRDRPGAGDLRGRPSAPGRRPRAHPAGPGEPRRQRR